MDFIHNILPAVEHLHVGGYWIAFFVALLETTIGIGLILPGSTVILFLGALSAQGHFDVGDLIWFAVSGAIIGDNLNYHLGKRYGNRWLKRGFWLLKPNHIEKAKYFMDAHGAKSIFLGRFIPSVKEVVPFIAGVVKMNRKTFMFWNGCLPVTFLRNHLTLLNFGCHVRVCFLRFCSYLAAFSISSNGWLSGKEDNF